MNLKLYKRLLRNIPLASAQDFQSFLDATAELDSSSENNAPLNSTQASQGRGKSFWRKFSFTRRSYNVEPVLPMAMSNLLRSETTEPVDQQDPSDLNEIRTVS